jgi:geranylgeranyl pyrophosphate synthase
MTSTAATLGELLAEATHTVEDDLRRWAVGPGTPDRLAEAVRYCLLGGGKRLRPALATLSAGACGMDKPDETVRRAAAALEMVHTYSLVHDDLPAMDDDDLRRGQPTVHVAYGEAMAILVGDALLTRAFELLAGARADCVASLCAQLAQAAGSAGMVAGQVADMDLCELPPGADGLWYIHERKTGALIEASVRMGAIGAGADAETVDALGRFGSALGKAFQLYDDLLDETGSVEALGKTPGKDARSGKRTAVSLLGLDGARRRGVQLTAEALGALDRLGERGDKLRKLANLLTARSY